MPVELIIFLLKKIVILEYQFLDVANLSRGDTLVTGQPDGLKPEFTFTVRSFDMNMGRFNSFIRVKMKPIGADPEYCWHQESLFTKTEVSYLSII